MKKLTLKTVVLGIVASGMLLIPSLPIVYVIGYNMFYLSFYCVPEEVYMTNGDHHTFRRHEDCESDEIRKQFLKFTLLKKDTPFRNDDVVVYKRNGKFLNRSFGRVEKVNTLDIGWSYEVVTVVGKEVIKEKVMHDWIFGMD